MNARDELAQVIATELDTIFGHRIAEPAQQDFKLADVLLAAGYSKPRTITTVEELDALPFGSVVIDRSEWVLCKRDERRYAVAGSAGQYSAATIEFPAAVLFTPEATK